MKSDKPKVACTHKILLFTNSLYPKLLMDNLKSQCPGVGGDLSGIIRSQIVFLISSQVLW